MIPQQNIEVHIVFPFRSAAEGISLHGGKGQEVRNMDDLVKIYWCVNPIRIGKERKLDIMNDKMDLFGIFKKDIGYRAFMAVDEPLDGLLFDPAGGEQIKIDGASMPEIKRDGCAADQIIIPREFFDQRQEFNLICCQNISVHADENIVEKNEPSAAGN